MASHRGARVPPPLSQSTRSWTDQDGTHYTVNSFSSNSGLSFRTMTGSSSDDFARNISTSAASRRSMFGDAFSMLEDMVAMQQQHRATFRDSTAHQSHKSGTRHVRVTVDNETEGEDDGLSYNQDGRRKSVFSRLKERLLDGTRSPKRGSGSSSSREGSSDSSPRDDHRKVNHRHHNHRAETRERVQSQRSRRPSSIHIVVEHDEEDSDNSDADSRNASLVGHSNLEALENTVEDKRRAVRACKNRLEQASRQSGVSSFFLQHIVDEIRSHEHALQHVTDRLIKEKSKQRSRIPHARARPHRHSYNPRQSEQRQSCPTLEDQFFPATFAGFGFEHSSPHGQYRNSMFHLHEHLNPFDPCSRAQSFGSLESQFEHLFGSMSDSAAEEPHLRFFEMPDSHPQSSQRKRTRYSQEASGTHRQSHHSSAFSTPLSPHPSPLPLSTAEAQMLFKSYNDWWNALEPTDPNIPYPARGLLASSLSARDSIWAPHLKDDISSWSDETVMQANAQTFYLGVVGLEPHYTVKSGTGQILCGIEKTSASPEQVKQLIDILKKEKPRWHSDRLGRRNQGVVGGGPNEILQKDVRARAVFHAVCELMDRLLE